MENLKNQKGIAAVEFALVLPILVLLIFGIIEFSLILYDKAVITNASREGARAGIVDQVPSMTSDQITSVVNNYCQQYLITFASGASPQTTVTGTGGSYGSNLTVQVSYPYTFLVLPKFITLGNSINLSATTVMRME